MWTSVKRRNDAGTDCGEAAGSSGTAGLTQRQAAELADVTPQTLLDLESDKRPPYMPTVTKLARDYGVPIEKLLDEE